jgi:hypothetical protein
VIGSNAGGWETNWDPAASDNRGTTRRSGLFLAVEQWTTWVKGQSFLVAELRTLVLLLSGLRTRDSSRLGRVCRNCRVWRVCQFD